MSRQVNGAGVTRHRVQQARRDMHASARSVEQMAEAGAISGARRVLRHQRSAYSALAATWR